MPHLFPVQRSQREAVPSPCRDIVKPSPVVLTSPEFCKVGESLDSKVKYSVPLQGRSKEEKFAIDVEVSSMQEHAKT